MLDDVRVILFDLGGTLADFPVPGWREGLGDALDAAYRHLVLPESDSPPPAADLPDSSEAGRRRSPAPPSSAFGHRLTVALRRIVRGISGTTLPHLAEACARPVLARGRLFPETLPVLDELHARGYPLGLISNTPWGTPDYLWERQLRRLGLADYFAVRLFSSDVGYRKPDRRIFDLALQKLGARPREAVYVGDHPEWDVCGAHGAGVRACLVRRPGQSDYPPCPADVQVRDLRQLLHVLPARAAGM